MTHAELLTLIGAERPVRMTFALGVHIDESALAAELMRRTRERDEAIEARNLIVAERVTFNLHRAEAAERRSSEAKRERKRLEIENTAFRSALNAAKACTVRADDLALQASHNDADVNALRRACQCYNAENLRLRAALFAAGCNVTPRVRSGSCAAAAVVVEHAPASAPASAPARAATAAAAGASSAAKARAFETIWAVEEAFDELLEAERLAQFVALDASLTPSSLYTGVRWNKKTKSWMCYVWADLKNEGKCKSVSLGRFDSDSAAARAYDRFVIENDLDKALNFASQSSCAATTAAASATQGQVPPHRLITASHRGGAQGMNPQRPLVRKRKRSPASPSEGQGRRLHARELKGTAANCSNSKTATPLQLKTCASIEEIACSLCNGGGDEAWMLLCGDGVDGCDRGFHAYCLDPPLKAMPAADVDWFCPRCTAERSSSGAHGATASAKRTAMPMETVSPTEMETDLATGVETSMETEIEMATKVVVAHATVTQAAVKQVAATRAVTSAMAPLGTRSIAVSWSTGGMEWRARDKASFAVVTVAQQPFATSDATGVANGAVLHAAPPAASPALPPAVPTALQPAMPPTVPPAMPATVSDVPLKSAAPTVYDTAVHAKRLLPPPLAAAQAAKVKPAACDMIESGCGETDNATVNTAQHGAAQAAAPRVAAMESGGADSERTRTRPTRERQEPIRFKPCLGGREVFLSFIDCVTGDRVVFTQHRGFAGHVETNSVDILENGNLWRSTQQEVRWRPPLCFVEWNAKKRTIVDYARKGSSLFTYKWTVPHGIDVMASGAAMEQCAASIGFEFRVSGKSARSTLLSPTLVEVAASITGPARARHTSDARSAAVAERPRVKRKRGSEYFGVYLDGSATKWKVEIYAEGRNQFLGHFDDETDAALAYDAFVLDKKLDLRINFPA
jgi:hypothetical protein